MKNSMCLLAFQWEKRNCILSCKIKVHFLVLACYKGNVSGELYHISFRLADHTSHQRIILEPTKKLSVLKLFICCSIILTTTFLSQTQSHIQTHTHTFWKKVAKGTFCKFILFLVGSIFRDLCVLKLKMVNVITV